MLEGIFHQRLENQRRHKTGPTVVVNLQIYLEAGPKTGLLEIQVELQGLELFGQGHGRPHSQTQTRPQEVSQLHAHGTGAAVISSDQ